MTENEVDIEIPDKLIPIFDGDADVRGAYGGRGSAKTRSFATMAAVYGYRYGMQGIKGQILCARQFMNSLAESSLEEIKRGIESYDFLNDYYEIGEKYIKSKDGNIEFTFAGLERNIDSVKSKGRILLCWIDEAEKVSEESYIKLDPTLREEGDDWNAELWVTWNPERKGSPTDKRYRNSTDPRTKIVQLNWRDNPRFPAILERKRQKCLIEDPDNYAHIWEGDYVTKVSGAYFATHILTAKKDNRIGVVAPNPLMKFHAFWDIGGTGLRADAKSIWIAQIIGRELRFVDYYESVGQELSHSVNWMRDNGYTESKCLQFLPHDGSTNDKVFDVSYESALKKAGYDVTVIPNQGKGAAMQRIEAARRVWPQITMNANKCEGGLEALAWYHEKKDDKREIGLGPEHDWSSHAADAFGLACIVYEKKANEVRRVRRRTENITWMG